MEITVGSAYELKNDLLDGAKIALLRKGTRVQVADSLFELVRLETDSGGSLIVYQAELERVL